MKSNKKSVLTVCVSMILAVLAVFEVISFSPAYAGTSGSYTYSVSGGEATIIGFSGSGDVTIPSEIDGYPVTAIGERAFFHKLSLTSVVIPDSVRAIADYSFMSNPSLVSVTIGNGVTDVGLEAFMSCTKLETLKFGNSLRRIGSAAFCACDLLEEVIIPDSVEIIGSGSFTNCTVLKTVKLGKSVYEIEKNAFYGCGILNEISVDEENGSFVSIDTVLYTKDMTEIIWCPMSKTTIDLPESVTIIGDGAFAGCGHIKDFSIPENVTIIGADAFMTCDSLTDLVISDSVVEAGEHAFAHISTLKSVNIGMGLEKISEGLFEGCKSLTDLTVPEGVTEIGQEAFKDCSSLKTITIPASVTSIGNEAFGKCYSLTDVYFGGTRSEWNVISANADVPEDAKVSCSDGVVISQMRFIDVDEGEYYAEPVAWAVEQGITSGTGKNTFSPNDGCTRGQVVTFLWRTAGSPEPKSKSNPFNDVKTDDYYYKAVLWAVEKNITKGTSNTKFSPSDVCTRGQIVTFLWRASGEPEPETAGNSFQDVKETDYFYDAVLWAVEKGITKGTSNKTFSPADTCTRGQVVTFLFRNQ
ncbi:MAG: leucine-rich repeat protein [Clostridia bacterium]|nr:leucine-rich repeat protein [Clostridia bacterium]